MLNALELQLLRAEIFNRLIILSNPNTTRFTGDTSYVNGKKSAYVEVLADIDGMIAKITE